MIDRHVFLIGMPGSGKSSLGKRLAGRLRMSYIDTDQRICDAAGCPVTEIFARYGEDAFRNAETQCAGPGGRTSPRPLCPPAGGIGAGGT